MIRLLLLLSAVGGLQATQKNPFPKPFPYYGKNQNDVYMELKDEQTSLCFKDYYAKDPVQDCILLMAKLSHVSTESKALTNSYQEDITANLNEIKIEATGVLEIKLLKNGKLIEIRFYMAGDYGGVTISAETEVEVRYLVQGNIQKTASYTSRKGQHLTGCRDSSGNAAILGEDTKGSNCETISCNSPGISPVIKNCPTNEKCNANNNCEYRATCTFTGPTAIDISGKLTTVKDRCNYILLESTKLLSFKVEGEYRERRRKHISHLENVKLTVDTKVYILKQGGRVEKGDGQLLTLTATETKFDSFSLAKTDAGVTAKYSKDGFEISVYFDGHTLQILTTGPTTKDPGLKKICADINERVAVRTIVDSCDKAQTDADVTKDVCDKAKTSCDVLKSTPFTSCNGVVKPDPYIKACKETMCKYPAEDNLMCSFLEAYARACKVQGRQDVTGFRSSASCPTTHKAFCPGKSCASQEFCALESGDFKCRCRPVFAAPFIKDNLLGDPTVCSANSASVTLINCLLTDKNIDYTTLHLKDKKCPGTFKDGNVTFTFNSDSLCDAEVKATDTEVTYKNNIMSSTDPNAAIIRQDQVNIEFKCTQTQPAIQSFSFKLQRSSVSKEVKSGSYDYTVSIEAFTDAARLQAVTEVVLNQKVYVNVKTTGLDDKVIAVVIDSCYASKDSDPTKDPKYQLITAGCANKEDNTVTVVGNGVSTSSYFSFNVFQFPNSNGDVHLHCKVKLCSTQGKSCLPDCTKQRRRRNAMPMYLDEAFITMAWNS